MGVGRLPWASSARRRVVNAYHRQLMTDVQWQAASARDSAQQVFVHTVGDVGQHSFPRHGAAMLCQRSLKNRYRTQFRAEGITSGVGKRLIAVSEGIEC
jgi:hypothetical protein